MSQARFLSVLNTEVIRTEFLGTPAFLLGKLICKTTRTIKKKKSKLIQKKEMKNCKRV